MSAVQSEHRSLFDLSEEYRGILADIETAEGEVTPEIEARLAALDEALLQNVDRYGWVIDRLTREAESSRDRAAVHAAHASVLEKQVERLKDRMCQALIAQGKSTVGGADWTVSIRHAERCVIDCAPSALPNEFQRIEIIADKGRIKQSIKNGIPVAGARIEKTPFIVVK